MSEFTLYIKKIEEDILIVSLVIGSNAGFVNKFKAKMEQVFEMTDLDEMSYFLGMEVHQKQNEIFICQQKYAKEIQNGGMQTYIYPYEPEREVL